MSRLYFLTRGNPPTTEENTVNFSPTDTWSALGVAHNILLRMVQTDLGHELDDQEFAEITVMETTIAQILAKEVG